MVKFRPATLSDSDNILLWINDEESRKFSLSKDEITAEDHKSWLQSMLANGSHTLLIISNESETIGVVRLDIYPPSYVEMSLTLSPKHHDKAVQTIEAVVAAQGGEKIVTRVIWNDHFRRNAFYSAGFRVDGDNLEMVMIDDSGTPLAIQNDKGGD